MVCGLGNLVKTKNNTELCSRKGSLQQNAYAKGAYRHVKMNWLWGNR